MAKKENMLHALDSFGILGVSLSGIRIERLEDRIRPGVPFPHKHDFFQIMLVTVGLGWHRIDFKKHRVAPQQLFLMKPGQMHSWELGKNVKGFIIEFGYQSLENQDLIKNFSFSPDDFTFTTKNDFQEALNLTHLMLEEFSRNRQMQDMCLQSYLTAFLILVIRQYQKQFNQNKALSAIERFRELIEKNYRQKHKVEFYARELKTSAKALTMQLSRSLGKPPREVIQARILLEAKRYLAFSSLTIAEIGHELGFEDANYFSRFFRIHEKKSPAQFRKEMSD